MTAEDCQSSRGGYVGCSYAESLRATECVTQSFDGDGVSELLTECLTLTCIAIQYAKKHGIDDRRGMKGFYQSLKQEGIPSCYKTAAIGRACEVIAGRKRRDEASEGFPDA